MSIFSWFKRKKYAEMEETIKRLEVENYELMEIGVNHMATIAEMRLCMEVMAKHIGCQIIAQREPLEDKEELH